MGSHVAVDVGRCSDDQPGEPEVGGAGPGAGEAEGDQRLGQRLRGGHPDRAARLPQRVELDRPVLLGVGQDEVRAQVEHVGHARVLRAADAGHAEVGRGGAPVGRPDQQPGRGHCDRLGQRRHQGDDAAHPRRDGDLPAGVVRRR